MVHVHIPAADQFEWYAQPQGYASISTEPRFWQAYMLAGRASILCLVSFSQSEHGLRPVHEMVLKCKLPRPSTTSPMRGTHMLGSGLRVAQHASIL
eukprot:1136248-Pelagomonas_calceolata.AAC.2